MNRSRQFFGTVAVLVGVALCGGCAKSPEPKFVLAKSTEEIVPVRIGDEKTAVNPVEAALHENFGTPNSLVAWELFPLDYGKAEDDLDHPERGTEGWKLLHGRNLYMQHCVHCHGTSGDGAGPTAKFLNPRPRDYRLGKFKFKSTAGAIRPSREDLRTTLEHGIPGTSMPSFVLLKDDLEPIIEYVRFLSMRGEYEFRLYKGIQGILGRKVLAKGGSVPAEAPEEARAEFNDGWKDTLEQVSTDLAEAWTTADAPESIINPREATILDDAKVLADPKPRGSVKFSGETLPADRRVKLDHKEGQYWAVKSLKDEELGFVHHESLEARTGIDPKTGKPTEKSLKRGRELYYSQAVACFKCHGYGGRGDGPSTEDFWEVGNDSPLFQYAGQKYEVRGLHDDWDNHLEPRNLIRGVYRGGRRPIDLYRKVFAGINGAKMPGFSTSLTNDSDLWDLVNFVTTLPYDQSILQGPLPDPSVQPPAAPVNPQASN